MDVTAINQASVAAKYYLAASSDNINTEKADNTFVGEVVVKKPDGTIVTNTESKILSNLKLENIFTKLSPQMLKQLIDGQQVINNTLDHRADQIQGSGNVISDSALPVGLKADLDTIANDPDYAAKRARELGTLPQIHIWNTDDFPKDGDPNSVWNEFHEKTAAKMEFTGQITRARSSYYHDMVAKDIPPAKIYANLLEFNANLPQNSGNKDVLENTYSVGGWDNDPKSQHDYLIKAMNNG